MTGESYAFSKDGRIVIRYGNDLTPWQVDPAFEYTRLAYASNRLLNHARAPIHRDGRILAVGTDRGVILWDLARKTELGFLPIGNAWHSMFEPSGDLLTNGDSGVLRWAIRSDPTSGELRVGPPRSLPLRGTHCGIDTDRTGQIVAVAGHQDARVALGNRTITIGPLDDCRGVSLSPDGNRLGHRAEARRCLDRATECLGRTTSLSAGHVKELAEFRAEAEAVLAGPTKEWPDDVFENPGAPPR